MGSRCQGSHLTGGGEPDRIAAPSALGRKFAPPVRSEAREKRGSSVEMWNRWARQPQRVWVRRATFQVHLWTGLLTGLYIVAISVTGSILVFRNEIIRAYGTASTTVVVSGAPLGATLMEDHVRRAYPGHAIEEMRPGAAADQALTVRMRKDDTEVNRLFDPYTGADLGDPLPLTFRVMMWLAKFHDDLLGGRTGRLVNAAGAAGVMVLSLTGIVIWWPGVKTWRRSLGLVWKTNWRRFAWHLHSAFGFWTLALIFIWGITGLYLSTPQPFSDAVDYFQPLDETSLDERLGDRILYWLAYLHFGRFGGRLPSCGAACDVTLKLVWTVGGLVPPLLAVTGLIMWWTRVVRKGA